MSINMDENVNKIVSKEDDLFINFYNKCYRLSAAGFIVANLIDEKEELKTKTKTLCLRLVSLSVNLRQIDQEVIKKTIIDIEKISLELTSLLDIASVSKLISPMNALILKQEFNSFLLEISDFHKKYNENKNASVKGIFSSQNQLSPYSQNNLNSLKLNVADNEFIETSNSIEEQNKNGRKHKKKKIKKNKILNFIKGHIDVSIKDIVPNIKGCSEKTIQREILGLIREGSIKKSGERRWSRYSAI